MGMGGGGNAQLMLKEEAEQRTGGAGQPENVGLETSKG